LVLVKSAQEISSIPLPALAYQEKSCEIPFPVVEACSCIFPCVFGRLNILDGFHHILRGVGDSVHSRDEILCELFFADLKLLTWISAFGVACVKPDLTSKWRYEYISAS
jgi:hypothetical protein